MRNFEPILKELFRQGYTFVGLYDNNYNLKYFKPPHLSHKEARNGKRYIETLSSEDQHRANKMRKDEEEQNRHAQQQRDMTDPPLTILQFAKKLNRIIGAKIYYKSRSGSIYSVMKTGETIRISDHEILPMDKNRYSAKQRTTFEFIIGGRWGIRTSELRDVINHIQEEVSDPDYIIDRRFTMEHKIRSINRLNGVV